MAHPTPRTSLRITDCLEELDNCVRTLEGLLDIVTPYTTDEGARAMLLRDSVAWALAPSVRALRAALNRGWDVQKQGGSAQ